MTVRAEFYARLREIVDASSLEITLPEGACVSDLMGNLSRDYPRLRDFEESMLFGIGVEFVDADQQLNEGDVVAIMPPVQGG